MNTRPARSNFEPWQGQKKPPGQFAMTVASPGVKRVFGRQPRCVQVPMSTSTSGLSERVLVLRVGRLFRILGFRVLELAVVRLAATPASPACASRRRSAACARRRWPSGPVRSSTDRPRWADPRRARSRMGSTMPRRAPRSAPRRLRRYRRWRLSETCADSRRLRGRYRRPRDRSFLTSGSFIHPGTERRENAPLRDPGRRRIIHMRNSAKCLRPMRNIRFMSTDRPENRHLHRRSRRSSDSPRHSSP